MTVIVIGEVWVVGVIILESEDKEYDGVITLTVLAAYCYIPYELFTLYEDLVLLMNVGLSNVVALGIEFRFLYYGPKVY